MTERVHLRKISQYYNELQPCLKLRKGSNFHRPENWKKLRLTNILGRRIFCPTLLRPLIFCFLFYIVPEQDGNLRIISFCYYGNLSESSLKILTKQQNRHSKHLAIFHEHCRKGKLKNHEFCVVLHF